MITVNSYFSGAGLFDYGLQQAGLYIQRSYEIDPVCIDTLKLNFEHDAKVTDITQKTVLSDPDCDAMVATYPCTRYSTIADISKTRTGDELYLHFFRHIAIKRPEIYVVENVPGMRKFTIVMEAMTKLPDYYVSVFCPVKAEYWLPQKRERLILIGSKKNFLWQPPSSGDRILLKDILDDYPDVEIPDYVYARLNGKYRDKPIVSDPDKNDLAPTCMAHYAKDVSTRLLKDDRFHFGVRPYSPREYARLQGVPDTFKFAGTSKDIYKMVGNGVPVPIGEWVGNEIMKYFNN